MWFRTDALQVRNRVSPPNAMRDSVANRSPGPLHIGRFGSLVSSAAAQNSRQACARALKLTKLPNRRKV